MAASEKFPALKRNRPRLLTVESGGDERHASWLELFFDLVFVLAVSRLSQILAGQSDLVGFAKFALLFVPVWWNWVGYTFYADRFETDETAYRLLMFAGMASVAAWSLTLAGAFTPAGDLPFVVCTVLGRLVLITLYIRANYYVPLARPLTNQFITGISIAVSTFALSLFFPAPYRYYLWAVAMLIELCIPFLNLRVSRTVPVDFSHIPERFGLFTIIVLGEAVISTANGASVAEWTPMTIAAAGVGFSMAAAVWWLNFDFVDDGAIRSGRLIPRFVYIYGNFFIVASIVILGVGVEHAIREVSEPHLHYASLILMSGGVALYTLSTTIIRMVVGFCYLFTVRLASIAVVMSLVYFGAFLPPIVVLLLLLGLLSIGIWLENRVKVPEDAEPAAERLMPCAHADQMKIHRPRVAGGCEECVKNKYKWVHLRLCMTCGHVGCCDSSVHKHSTRHFHAEGHPVIASLEEGEHWAWCFVDERFVPLHRKVVASPAEAVE